MTALSFIVKDSGEKHRPEEEDALVVAQAGSPQDRRLSVPGSETPIDTYVGR